MASWSAWSRRGSDYDDYGPAWGSDYGPGRGWSSANEHAESNRPWTREPINEPEGPKPPPPISGVGVVLGSGVAPTLEPPAPDAVPGSGAASSSGGSVVPGSAEGKKGKKGKKPRGSPRSPKEQKATQSKMPGDGESP